jgi:hypothetical protein
MTLYLCIYRESEERIYVWLTHAAVEGLKIKMASSKILQAFVNYKKSIFYKYPSASGPGSSVGIVTVYGPDDPGIESLFGARFSAPVQTGPGAHPASRTMGTESFSGVKSGRGVTLTPHPLLVPLVMKEYSYTSTPPMGCTTCTEHQCLYSRAILLLP